MIEFTIKSFGPISKEFLNRNILSFNAATNFILHLPYKRNTDKTNLLSVFADNCGTCSTKHGLLKQLAIENDITDLQLMIGIVKMNASNTPQIKQRLINAQLEFIPEAHCYLKYNGHVLDYTKPNFKLNPTGDTLLTEIEIMPKQISDYKVQYHQTFIEDWLLSHPQINYTLSSLWELREQCIRDLEIG